MKTRAGVLSLFALMASSAAMAGQPTGPYIGILGGSTKLSISYEDTEDPDYSVFYRKNKATFGAFAGWQFGQYVGLELSYNNVASIAESETVEESTIKASYKLEGFGASVIGTWPLDDTWSFFGRAGATRFEGTAKVRMDDELVDVEKEHDTRFTYGAGIGAIVEGARVRLEYSRTEIPDGHIGLLSLGIVWFLHRKD